MLKRVIEISRARTRLSIRYGQLIVENQEEGSRTQIPCEDIGLLLVDHVGTVYTHSVFTELLKHGAGVVLCGGDHHPAGMLLAMEGNVVQAQRMGQQIGAKAPLKKRLWKQIVQAKIRHQAAVVGPESRVYETLLDLARKVKSGDTSNVEAQASKKYWGAYLSDLELERYRVGQSPTLPETFRRRIDGAPPNNLLNYGYMVLRAAAARALSGSGLICSLGLHHHNKYNAFCLADDVMEPYRGYVEKKVRDVWADEGPEGCEELDQSLKARLLEVLYEPVTIGDKSGPLMVNLHRTASSLVKCYTGEQAQLELPKP